MCYNKEHKAEHGYNMNVYNNPSNVLPSLRNVQQSISSLTPHVCTSLISMYNNSHTPTFSLSLVSTSFTHSELRLHTRQSVHPWLCDKQTVLFCIYVSGCARLKPRYLVEKIKWLTDEHSDLWHTTSLLEAKHRVTRGRECVCQCVPSNHWASLLCQTTSHSRAIAQTQVTFHMSNISKVLSISFERCKWKQFTIFSHTDSRRPTLQAVHTHLHTHARTENIFTRAHTLYCKWMKHECLATPEDRAPHFYNDLLHFRFRYYK